jgi:hypothetical protein
LLSLQRPSAIVALPAALTPLVVTSASHDLALAWHPVLSSSSPLLSSLFRRYIHTQKELFTRPGLQPRDVIPLKIFHNLANVSQRAFRAYSLELQGLIAGSAPTIARYSGFRVPTRCIPDTLCCDLRTSWSSRIEKNCLSAGNRHICS